MIPTAGAHRGLSEIPANPSERIRVLIAESTRMGSELMQAALKKHQQRFTVQALASGSSEVYRELERSKPDVTILSGDLQDGCLMGFRVLYQLRESQSRTRVVMLLDSPERELVIEAFRGGARGIFTRADRFGSISKCISAVNEGQIWVTNAQLDFLLELVMRLKPPQVMKPGGMALLSKREVDVVRLVAEGMRNEEIALKLGVVEHSVRNYLCRIFEKLGLSNRVELVLYALSR